MEICQKHDEQGQNVYIFVNGDSSNYSHSIEIKCQLNLSQLCECYHTVYCSVSQAVYKVCNCYIQSVRVFVKLELLKNDSYSTYTNAQTPCASMQKQIRKHYWLSFKI